MKKARTSPATTELLWLLGMSWVARDGAVAELRDAPVRGLAGYGRNLLVFAEYLRREEPALWHRVHSEIAAEIDASDEHRRSYLAQMARQLATVAAGEEILPDEGQAAPGRRAGETEGFCKRPT